ncbi:KICSTOR subunit 2-like isoform X2 [Ostrea edulis]|nr:KICSTOR subunit 2-like isoform X2 [Ostrea edulis]XP_048729250.1 KICSTOR subunit 2-like isoform X2 [Ostrea edulis]XP_048729251.1 KICSTOR subunit 2-like isoform X2 [Ostrea edulis]
MSNLSSISPNGEKEEQFLENYFSYVSHCEHDKAKELAEKERDAHKALFGSSWGLFLMSLSQFASAEKTYMSLGFLEQRGFFTRSKETLKSGYQTLMYEFRRVEEAVKSTEEQSFGMSHNALEFEKLLAHLCDQLCFFTQARQETINFYEQVHIMGMTKHVNFEDLNMVIKEIIAVHSKNFHHPILAPLKTVFGFECDTLNLLLVAQTTMSDWMFLTALLHIHEAHTKLSSWGGLIQPKEIKKSTFGGSSKHGSPPALYQWLTKFKNLLLSKFSIYFYDILQKQASPPEMKSLISKTPDDFVTRIQTFHKKADACHVSLVLNTQGLDRVFPEGYQYPGRLVETPQGLNTFPAIFSFPGERLSNHFPAVVMMLTEWRDREELIYAQDKIHYMYDKGSHSSYFYTQVDTRTSLVVIFESKKSEKDSYVNNFMNDIATQLRCTKFFTSLKPGSK